MSKTIILSEHQIQLVMNKMLSEELSSVGYNDKVLQVKKYLDDNFTKAKNDIGKFDSEGNRQVDEYVSLVDKNRNVLKLMTDRQLFDLLQEKFKNILPNKEEDDKKKRDEFLKSVMIAWYNHKIDKNGSITN